MAWLYDLAQGHDSRPLNPDMPPLRVIRTFMLSEPAADKQLLVNAAGRVSGRLGQALASHGYQTEALKLSGLDVDGQEQHAAKSVRPPTSDEARLARLAAQLLGELVFNEPVVSLALCTYPLRHWTTGVQQTALVSLDQQAKERRIDEMLQLIQHRFGEAAVRSAALVGPPQPVSVPVRLNDQGQPAEFGWAGVVLKVVSLDEWWREEGGWWAERPARRDYYQVEVDTGGVFNLFKDLTDGAWYVDLAWPRL